jgi:hypothetical protein
MLTGNRCPQQQVRADELDAFVFGELRSALLRPEVLLAGQTALAERTPSPDDELLDAQLRHLNRKLEHADAERRRLVDLYQTGLLELADLQRRAKDVEARRRHLDDQRDALIAQRRELARDNQVRQRVADFARQVTEGLDAMDFEHRQRLVRLLVEEVRIIGWKVEMRLRIPLDDGPHPAPAAGPREGDLAVSSNERLRSRPQ